MFVVVLYSLLIIGMATRIIIGMAITIGWPYQCKYWYGLGHTGPIGGYAPALYLRLYQDSLRTY